MKIHYKKTTGVLYIVIGIIFACLYLMFALANGKGNITLLIVGVLGILFGILFLTRTYFIVNDGSLVLNALLGPAKTTYSFRSLKELELEKNRIFLIQNGKRKKLGISARMADKNEWEAFLQKINSMS